MRKVKLQMQLSLDGFVAGPNAEMDWMTMNWGEDINSYVKEITEAVDCILLGHHLAQGFVPTWQGMQADPATAEDFVHKMVDTPKLVFSKTKRVADADWKNVNFATQSPDKELADLKKMQGGDIMVYGGASLVSQLIAQNLIDEYHLFINPILMGNGMPIFKELNSYLKLELVSCKTFECGIVVLCYKPAKND